VPSRGYHPGFHPRARFCRNILSPLHHNHNHWPPLSCHLRPGPLVFPLRSPWHEIFAEKFWLRVRLEAKVKLARTGWANQKTTQSQSLGGIPMRCAVWQQRVSAATHLVGRWRFPYPSFLHHRHSHLHTTFSRNHHAARLPCADYQYRTIPPSRTSAPNRSFSIQSDQ
jgi:hypothetical protein